MNPESTNPDFVSKKFLNGFPLENQNSQEKPKTTDIPAFFEKSRVPPANSVPDENIDFPNFQNSSPKPTLTEEKIVSEARD